MHQAGRSAIAKQPSWSRVTACRTRLTLASAQPSRPARRRYVARWYGTSGFVVRSRRLRTNRTTVISTAPSTSTATVAAPPTSRSVSSPLPPVEFVGASDGAARTHTHTHTLSLSLTSARTSHAGARGRPLALRAHRRERRCLHALLCTCGRLGWSRRSGRRGCGRHVARRGRAVQQVVARGKRQ